ncbi:MAG: C39 family peptidase [Planctomycetota bacterium]|nr:C39 family peptidase [Planctomycetota bacterium]
MRFGPALLFAILAACAAPAATPVWDATSGAARPARVHLRVVGRAQERSLSCESRSACDLLAAYGIHVPEDTFRLGLPVSDNPDLGFVGDVDGPGEQLPPAGYGVHAEPIAARVRALGLHALASRGRTRDWLLDRLAEGRPVIVWATGQLDAPVPVTMHDATGRAFVVARGEHTFLAIGYQPGQVLLIDAATGRTKAVFFGAFERSWSVLGRQAVVASTPR